MLPLAPEMVEGVRAEAAAFADELAALDVRSPAFTEKIEAITSMGAAEIPRVGLQPHARPAAALSGTSVDRCLATSTETPSHS